MGGGTTLPCRPTLFKILQAFVRLSPLKWLLGREYDYVGATKEGVGISTSAAPPHQLKHAIDPPSPSPSSPAPVPIERVSLATLPALIRGLQATRQPDASTAAVYELREELRAIHEKLAATQEEIGGVAGDWKAAVEMYHQMQCLSPGGGGREASGLAAATRGWSGEAARSDENARSRLCCAFCSIVCRYMGVELPATVPVVQCTLTVMARSHVAADPPTIVC